MLRGRSLWTFVHSTNPEADIVTTGVHYRGGSDASGYRRRQARKKSHSPPHKRHFCRSAESSTWHAQAKRRCAYLRAQEKVPCGTRREMPSGVWFLCHEVPAIH